MIANNDGKHGIHGQAFRKTSMSIVAVVQPHCLSKYEPKLNFNTTLISSILIVQAIRGICYD